MKVAITKRTKPRVTMDNCIGNPGNIHIDEDDKNNDDNESGQRIVATS